MAETETAKSERLPHQDVVDALRALIESAHQAEHDLVGQQREYHLPRIRLAMTTFTRTFPHLFPAAMVGAVDGYGDLLFPEAK